MRLPGWEITVRRLMLVVALVGLFFAGGDRVATMSRLSGEYAGKAQRYMSLEAYYRQDAASLLGQAKSNEKLASANRPVEDIGNEPLTHASKEVEKDFAGQAGDDLGRAARAAAKADYYAALARKYDHAARYPWLPAEPDPPEP
jgi:hypothetical protein